MSEATADSDHLGDVFEQVTGSDEVTEEQRSSGGRKVSDAEVEAPDDGLDEALDGTADVANGDAEY